MALPTTSGFDFFAAGALPAPALPREEVEHLVREQFGLVVQLEPLGSQQDQNLLVRGAAGGPPVAVLKIANPAFSAAEVEAQDAAADAVAEAHPRLRVARVLRRDGAPLRAAASSSQGPLVLRLLQHLPHGTLVGAGYLPPSAVAAMGGVAGAVSTALAGFSHPGTERVLQWDLRQAARVVDLLVDAHPDPDRRERVRRAAAQARARLEPLAADLPLQVGHLDLTDDNLVARAPGSRVADGVLDFGDVSTSWAVAELAVTLSSLLHHPGAQPASVLPAVHAFAAQRPLAAPEVDALWPLVVLRGAVLVVSGEHQVAVDGANDYARAALEREWRILEVATSVPVDVVTELLRSSLGLRPRRPPLPAGRPLLDAPAAVELDLSTTSAAADDGAWLDEGLEERAAAAALAGGPLVVAPVGPARVGRSRPLSTDSPATVPTAAAVWSRAPAPVRAPWAGRLHHAPGGLVLAADGVRLHLRGLEPAPEGDLAAGEPVGTAPAGGRVDVQLLAGALDVPLHVRPEHAAGWLAHVHDPGPLLGLPARPAGPEPAELLARRERVLAEVQEHYYDAPPRVERGWRHHLLDTAGRSYLDMVNNVASVGHAHPRVTAAMTAQARRLNTNSRFHYAAVVELAEQVAGLLPDPLDTVFFVNSGSEAVDLSLRIAMAATGRRDVVAVLEAYHGWTYASDAVSTSIADNPQALATRPDWVHTLDAPNAYRGRHRDADAVRYGPEAAERISALAASGRPPAAFLAESWYGNAGGVRLPDGYLAQVYAAVRAAGGLAVADEVQVGYGRLGEWFWGFEQQGVVPDVVAAAKAVGNGHPLGFVVTSQDVAARFRTQGYFFSSSGGSPVSCAVGSAVLGVIRDERLQDNARAVGTRLREGLLALADRHPLVGTVHGAGLYLGVELVRDRSTREPATEETAAVCDRLLELGVVMQPTGDHQNVLKVKPPLCLDAAGADFFVAALDRVLAEDR